MPVQQAPATTARTWPSITRRCAPWLSTRVRGRAGLGAALLVSKGMAAWMRGWRACTPAPLPSPGTGPARTAVPELVGVLAAMALACT